MSFVPPIANLPIRTRGSLAALLLANVLPLAGVVFLGWDVLEPLLVYWAESMVIGGYTLLRMLTAGQGGPRRLFLMPFFVVHYGMFVTIQLVVMLGFLGLDPRPALASPALHGAVAGFVASHGYSFVAHWLRGPERANADAGDEFSRPYARVFVQQIVVIFGGWILLMTGDARGYVALLVALKIAVDVVAHLREHHAPPA